MRYIILIFIILISSIADAQEMKIIEKSGAFTSYGLSDINKITFDDTNQSIDLKNGSATTKISGIRKITFSFGVSSNANLATLTSIQGTLSPAFAAYTVSLPEETTTVPTVSATAADANATVSITQAANLTGSAAAQHNATVVLTAEDGTTTKTYTVVFSVQSATPDFSLNASTTNLSIPQGAFGTTDISFTPSGGFTGPVALSIDDATPLPAGVTAQFTPASISSGSSTLRQDVDASLLTITADEDSDLGASEPPVVVIPANQFSPNGDGIDDTCQITDIEKAPQLFIPI